MDVLVCVTIDCRQNLWVICTVIGCLISLNQCNVAWEMFMCIVNKVSGHSSLLVHKLYCISILYCFLQMKTTISCQTLSLRLVHLFLT